MRKARFAEKQKEVTLVTVDGQTTVRVCLHESPVDVENPETGEITGQEYLYDSNEWSDAEDNIDEDAIKANPEDYLDYEPTPELSDSEKIEKALANSEYAIILAGGEV